MLRVPGFVTSAEASKLLGGVSSQTLSKWAAKGLITAKQLPGGQFIYAEDSLDINKLCTPVSGGTDAPKVDGRKNRKRK